MHLSLHLDFTLWNVTAGAHCYHFLTIMPIALTYKATALLIQSSLSQELDEKNSSHHLLSTAQSSPEQERDFKELAHAIMQAGQSEILKPARHASRLEIAAGVRVPGSSPKAVQKQNSILFRGPQSFPPL